MKITPEGGSTTTHGPGCEAVTGYAAGEFEANPSLWYEIIQMEDRPAVLTHIASVLTGQATPPRSNIRSDTSPASSAGSGTPRSPTRMTGARSFDDHPHARSLAVTWDAHLQRPG